MEQSKFYQIKNVTEHEYTLVGCDGSVITRSIQEIDKSASAFNIEDAKDGDVLACKIDGDSYILIYKQIKDGWIETYGHYYDSVDRFCVPSQLFCREVKGTFHPATKEQRDQLGKAMANAGYEWSYTKKELIKL